MTVLDSAEALEWYYSALAKAPPELRGGIHCSDVVGTPGWDCDRYVQFVALNAGTNSVESRKHWIKRWKIGEGVHNMTYDHIELALEMWCAETGVIIEEVIIEEVLEDKVSGLVCTPDIVIKYRIKAGAPLRTQVLDIKSLSHAGWKNMQGVNGIRISANYLRQIMMYGDLITDITGSKVDEAAFLFITVDKPYQHVLKFVPPTGRILEHTRARIARIEKITESGQYASKTESTRDCADCIFLTECTKVDRSVAT